MIACLKLQMFRRLLTYSTLMFVAVALMDLNLSNLPYDLIQEALGSLSTANLDLATLSLRILSNGIMAQLASVAAIVICCVALAVFWQLLKAHNPIHRHYLLFIAGSLMIYFAYNTNAIWHLTGKPLLEAHFTQITYTDQVKAIRKFNALRPTGTQAQAAVTELRTKRSGHFLDDCQGAAHCINNTTLNMSFVLYWLAYFLLSATAFIGLATASTVYAPTPALANEQPPGLSKRSILLDEYRNRCDTLRSILYFGSTTLLVGIVWLNAHTNWALTPILTTLFASAENDTRVLAHDVFFNNYRTYMTIFYSLILMIGFVPGVLYIRSQALVLFRTERDLVPFENRGDITFDDWLADAYLPANILNVKDLAFLMAPMASLLVGSNLTDTFAGLTAFQS